MSSHDPLSSMPQGMRAAPDIVTASDDYATRFSGDAGAYLLKVQEQTVERLMRLTPAIEPGAVILDHGGTHGQLADMLERQGIRRFVSASDATIVDRADTAVECIHGPLDRLCSANGQFDTVISVRLLAHADDLASMVAEMCRLAGRSVIVDYPPRRSVNALSGWLFSVKKRFEGNTRQFETISDAELRRLFDLNGFEHVATVRQFAVPMVVHRLMGSAAPLRALEKLARMCGLTRVLGNPAVARFDRRSVG